MTGERFDEPSTAALHRLRRLQAERVEVQIAISDGLNALAIMEDDHLGPFLERLRAGLDERELNVAPEHLVITSGRVRAGYRVGERLFAHLDGPRAILHVIGESAARDRSLRSRASTRHDARFTGLSPSQSSQFSTNTSFIPFRL